MDIRLIFSLGWAAFWVLVALAAVLPPRRRWGASRIVQITPCAGWVARYRGDREHDGGEDGEGCRCRPVAAWAVVHGGRVVGLTTDYETVPDYMRGHAMWRPRKLARPPLPHLVRCDELAGFVGYDEVGR